MCEVGWRVDWGRFFEVFEVDINDGGEVEGEELGDEEAADDGDAEGASGL